MKLVNPNFSQMVAALGLLRRQRAQFTREALNAAVCEWLREWYDSHAGWRVRRGEWAYDASSGCWVYMVDAGYDIFGGGVECWAFRLVAPWHVSPPRMALTEIGSSRFNVIGRNLDLESDTHHCGDIVWGA